MQARADTYKHGYSFDASEAIAVSGTRAAYSCAVVNTLHAYVYAKMCCCEAS